MIKYFFNCGFILHNKGFLIENVFYYIWKTKKEHYLNVLLLA
jgi:hypothetical protein